jgi:hypothetical protein
MSKAKHALITSKAGKPSQRLSAVPSEECKRARALAVELTQRTPAVFALEEGTPEREAAEVAWYRLQDKFNRLAKAIWKRPVRSWSDVAELAEIAWYLGDVLDPKDGRKTSGMFAHGVPPRMPNPKKEYVGIDAVASAHLLIAALKMGGAHV